MELRQKQWNLFFIFFCLTKRNKSQERTPYFVFMRSKSLPANCYKNKISLRSSTPTAPLPTYAIVYNNLIPLKMSNDHKNILHFF
jgi:hypothetical protein